MAGRIGWTVIVALSFLAFVGRQDDAAPKPTPAWQVVKQWQGGGIRQAQRMGIVGKHVCRLGLEFPVFPMVVGPFQPRPEIRVQLVQGVHLERP